jgi:superfamily II DNA/RNA helicase
MRELAGNSKKSQNEKGPKSFPLFEKAENQGVFKAEKGWLISAPTATGKSYIGIEIIKRNLADKPALEVFLYVVPFKALAEEIYLKLKHELPENIKINIKTGDYDRQFDLTQTDVLVATYESIDGLIQTEKQFYPTIIIADEFSIISDNTRGARIESLIAYLAKNRTSTILYVLSAVLENPKRIADWLNLRLLEGTQRDRQVRLARTCIFYSEGRKKDVVEKLVKDGLQYGNFIVFCGTKPEAEKLAKDLKSIVSRFLGKEESEKATQLAVGLKQEFPYLVELEDLVANGVAFHHAGLEVDLRKRLSDAFRDRRLKLICATPTLSAGVNLPARFVIVKDLRHGREKVTVAELVNMLGRAGRPGYDSIGTGYFLFPKEFSKLPPAKRFISRVKNSEVEKIESQIGRNITNTLYFVLSTAARLKGITRDELIEIYNTTLWGHENPLLPPLLPANELGHRIEKAVIPPVSTVLIEKGSIHIQNGSLKAKGGSRNYDITIAPQKCSCSCPDYKMRHNHECKHIKQLRYDAILGNVGKDNPEARTIAVETFQTSGLSNDPMYMLSNSVDLLLSWSFLGEKDAKLNATQDGIQALSNYLLDMAHVRLLRDRMTKCETPKNEEEIIKWAIEDYRNSGTPEDTTESDLSLELKDAVIKHIQDGPYKEILPQKQIQLFLNVKDRLDQIFRAYLAFCPKNNKQLRSHIRTARRRVHYGCKTELLPVMVLNMQRLNEASKARSLYKHGMTNVDTLSKANVIEITQLLAIPQEEAKNMIESAQSVVQLIQNYEPTTETAALNMLATRTEIKVDDLVDYFLPNCKFETFS